MSARADSAFRLSPAFCAHNGVAVLDSRDGLVTLGMARADDGELRGRIERAWPDSRFAYAPLGAEELALRLNRMYAEERGGNAAADGPGAPGGQGEENPAIDRPERDAPVVSLLNSIFLEAVSMGASDVHLESEARHATVRYRIDGRLRVMAELTKERGAALSARLKHLANLNIIERRRPQDGRIDMTGPGYTLDVRVSVVPTVKGESVVLRLLNADRAPLGLDALGFSEGELGTVRGAIKNRSGLILIVGPTGSGKTTTLQAILRELKNDETKIVSVEDPVEYRIDGITQIQTDDALSLSFGEILRRIFRQDPDIIMLGEIRDSASASLACRAALTGHLVFATLHASGSLEAIPRLLNLGAEPYLVAEVARLVVAQRLARRVCAACRGSGCARCAGAGYSGRVVISESLSVGDGVRRAIETGYSAHAVKSLAVRGGFRTLREDADAKIAAGVTDEAEILRELGR